MSSLNNDAQHEAHCAASVLADRASGPANSREARSAELSEENYRHIIELSPQIPWIADGLGNVTEVGPQWAELIGISREEGLGLDSLLHVHPDDVNQTAQRWVRSIETGEPLDSTIRLRLNPLP